MRPFDGNSSRDAAGIGTSPGAPPCADGPPEGVHDLREILERGGHLDAAGLLELFCDDQVDRWYAGLRIPAEAYLSLHPALGMGDERAFELIYGEFVLRESLGESPALEEFTWRFPGFADRFRRQLSLHLALRDGPDAAVPGPARMQPGVEAVGERRPSRPEVPGYRILGELGRGGMGVVYKARQLSLNRLVALKVIRAGLAAERGAAARFRAEAEVVARFQHPNIIQVYEVGDCDDLGYLALEYADGGSLQRKIANAPQEPRAAAKLLESLARAVDYAHRRGIVHRDLKPANVVLTEEGVPKITDFGLAKLLEGDASVTQTGAILGTPSYMAPEQARGHSRAISPATDVYALGAILYELLTGHPPFHGATPISTLEQVATQEPVPPGRLQRHAPRDLETICLKCLEKEPRRRYATAQVLADDLARYLDGRPILARPTPAWLRAWKWSRRRPSMATAVGCLAAAVALLLLGSAYYNARLRSAARAADAGARDALEQRNQTLEALNKLVYEVQEKLVETPATRMLRRGLLDTAIAGLDKIAASAEASAPDLSRAVAHQKLGEIFIQVGRPREARRQLAQSIGLAERLAADARGDVAVAECLYAAYSDLGDLDVSADRLDQALRDFHHVVGLAEQIAASRPEDDASRRVRIEAYFRLGRAYGFSHDFEAAEVWFRKMHDLAERWVSGAPSSTLARDLLAASHRKLADLRKFSDDLDAARVDYLKAIALGREILAAEPRNLEFRAHLAIGLDDLAQVEARRGAPAEARRLYNEAIRLLTGLIEADPETIRSRILLIHTRSKLADLSRDEWLFDEAADHYRQARAQLARLDREGRLEDIPGSKDQRLRTIDREIAFCETAAALLGDMPPPPPESR